jgi:hypothetical protein
MPVPLSHAETPDGTFCRIIISRNVAILKEYSEVFFLVESIGAAFSISDITDIATGLA